MLAARCGRSFGPAAYLSILALLSACGGGGDAGADADSAAADTSGLAVCDLLTAEEVNGVLPGHDGGIVTSSGGSLIDGVDTYQCSYTAQGASPADLNLLTVIVTVASTAELFDGVRPTAGAKRDRYENFEEIDLGDGGFAYGEPDDMMVDAWQGTKVVSLELMAGTAEGQRESLLALAAALLSRIG